MRQTSSSPQTRRVLIYGPSLSKGFGHQFILGFMEGIGRFARQRPNWRVTPGLEMEEYHSMTWKGDGAIVQQAPKELTFSEETKVVRIGSNPLTGQHEHGVVRSDHYQIGVLAADHLLEMGFSHFAYFGRIRERGQGFLDRLLEKGVLSRVWVEKDIFLAGADNWLEENNTLCTWLKTLPLPIAIFAQMDVHAYRILQAAQLAGLSVSEDIALLGVDNDETLCNLSTPTLSSIEQPAVQIGYRAAQLLDELMEGKTPKETDLVLPPLGVRARKSTGRVLDVSPLVRSALKYLRDHFQEEIRIGDMVHELGASRRTVERAFRENLGLTIGEEVTRLRLSQARETLRSTSWTLDEVAENSGFQSVRQFHDAFKRHENMTPATYRKTFQMF